MSVGGVNSIGQAGAIAAAMSAQASRAPGAIEGGEAGGAAAYFDMTSWTGPAEASVTVGPAAAKAALPELSASVLSAILR